MILQKNPKSFCRLTLNFAVHGALTKRSQGKSEEIRGEKNCTLTIINQIMPNRKLHGNNLGRLMWWCQGVILGTKVSVASHRHQSLCLFCHPRSELTEGNAWSEETNSSFAKKRM